MQVEQIQALKFWLNGSTPSLIALATQAETIIEWWSLSHRGALAACTGSHVWCARAKLKKRETKIYKTTHNTKKSQNAGQNQNPKYQRAREGAGATVVGAS